MMNMRQCSSSSSISKTYNKIIILSHQRKILHIYAKCLLIHSLSLLKYPSFEMDFFSFSTVTRTLTYML